MKLNYHVKFDMVRSMVNTKHDSDMIDRIGVVYDKIGS